MLGDNNTNQFKKGSNLAVVLTLKLYGDFKLDVFLVSNLEISNDIKSIHLLTQKYGFTVSVVRFL